MELIDKATIVAEIERKKDKEVDYDESSGNFASYADQIHYSALDSVENFINTLEVKEVDLEKELERLKQGEQNSANKVERKFHKGDWITIDNPCQIMAIDENYIVQYCDDEKTHEISKKFCEYQFHLWTIQDAKDGDVLTTDTWTFIFKKYQAKFVYYHCAASTFNNFSISDTGEFDSNYVHPATKEQRDLLFQKMKEAGYEWDAEKKELKKIEQKPA